MRLITHLLVGVTLSSVLKQDPITIIIGSLLPDIDLIIGLRHRGLTHSLWMLATIMNTPLSIGVISHITLDLLTISGCRLLYPRKTYYVLTRKPVSDEAVILVSAVMLFA